MLTQNAQSSFHRKIIYTMLSWSTWANIAQENYLCNVEPQSTNNFAQEYYLFNVVQTRLRKHCTWKLLVKCWPRSHGHVFAAPNNLGSFCSMVAREFIYLLGNNEQGPTVTGRSVPGHFSFKRKTISKEKICKSFFRVSQKIAGRKLSCIVHFTMELIDITTMNDITNLSRFNWCFIVKIL